MLLVFSLASGGCSNDKNQDLVVGWFNSLGSFPHYVTTYSGYLDDCLYNGKMIMSDYHDIFYLIGDGQRWVEVEIEYRIVLDDIVIERICIDYTNTINQTRYEISNSNYTIGITTTIELSQIKKVVQSLAIEDWIAILQKID